MLFHWEPMGDEPLGIRILDESPQVRPVALDPIGPRVGSKHPALLLEQNPAPDRLAPVGVVVVVIAKRKRLSPQGSQLASGTVSANFCSAAGT